MLREAAGMTQQEIGVQLGVSRNVVSNWERGVSQPDNDFLLPLCQIFHCSPTKFLNIDKHTYEWYLNTYKVNGGSIEEYAVANPDIMEMQLYLANEWDGNYPILKLMDYMYAMLDEEDRSHISYLLGMMFKARYEFADRSPLVDKAYKRLPEFVDEWHNLNAKAEEKRRLHG